jgi:hypothetical protein
MSQSFAVPQFAQFHVLKITARKAIFGTVAVVAIKFRFAWVARMFQQLVASSSLATKFSLIHTHIHGSLVIMAVEQAHTA